jgi:hypothetical protein
MTRAGRAAVVLLLIVFESACTRSEDHSPITAPVPAPEVPDAGPAKAPEARLDYSSKAAFKASLERLRLGLDEKTEKELEISLMAITLHAEGDETRVKQALDGKTARQIIEYANGLE